MSSVGARDDGTTGNGLALVTESRPIITAKVIDLHPFGHVVEHHDGKV